MMRAGDRKQIYYNCWPNHFCIWKILSYSFFDFLLLLLLNCVIHYYNYKVIVYFRMGELLLKVVLEEHSQNVCMEWVVGGLSNFKRPTVNWVTLQYLNSSMQTSGTVISQDAQIWLRPPNNRNRLTESIANYIQEKTIGWYLREKNDSWGEVHHHTSLGHCGSLSLLFPSPFLNWGSCLPVIAI